MGAQTLDTALAALVAEARAAVAAGREPDAAVLAGRIRATVERARPAVGAAAAREAERRALRQVERVAAVHRARTRPPAAPPPPPPPTPARRASLRTRATVTGNMDVRRVGTADEPVLAWEAAAAVESWEIRISERPDPRSDYALVETRTAPAGTTHVALPLRDLPLRVNVLGRARGGRLLRRALVSALTRENWADRWERRASAS